MYSIGVDIGGSHITSCMFEHTNKGLDKSTWVHKSINSQGEKEGIIEEWVSAISKTIELSGKDIKGVGIAMPGPFNYYDGISQIRNVNKLDALYGVNIREELALKLRMPLSNVRFINDASAFSIAEALVGRASKFQRVVAITLGTGLGASFLQEGLPLINVDNVPEGGFLYNKSYKGNLADDIFSTRGIIKCYKDRTGETVANVKELAERAASNKDAQEVFAWFGTELGKFLSPYLDTFKAEVLVIGGNIAKANELFVPNLQEQLPGVHVYISDFGEEAAVIGGALLLEEDFYKTLIPTLKLM